MLDWFLFENRDEGDGTEDEDTTEERHDLETQRQLKL